MANTKNDVAQQATRWFLSELGRRYDESRGLQPFRPTDQQWQQVLDYFRSECAYCGEPMASAPILKDHLIPLNRVAGGLHAWGNVVPSCRPCNNSKGSQSWRDWLRSTHRATSTRRIKRIEAFAKQHRYSLETHFADRAEELYRKVVKYAERAVNAEVEHCLKTLPFTGDN